MSSPIPLVTAIVIYLWLIYKVLPAFMESRKAYELTTIIRIYNALQVIICACFVVRHHMIGVGLFSACTCMQPKNDETISSENMEFLKMHYLFIFLRLFEFIETIFFILRKKSNQVSALHVYHHIAVVVLLWLHLKYNGGPMDNYIGILNSSIHVIMYTYYFFSSFQKFTSITKTIKPLITTVQIIQLSVLFLHCCVALMPSCNASKIYIVQTLNLALLIFMFLRFFVKNFNAKKKSAKNC